MTVTVQQMNTCSHACNKGKFNESVLVMRATMPLIGAMQQPYATGDSIFTRPPGSDRLLEILFNS